jgi:formyl-CoA transferase
VKRINNVLALTEVLSDVFRSRPSSEWGAHLFAERIPAAPVNGVAEAVAQPLALLRKMVEQLENPRGAGILKFLGNPLKYESGKPLSYPPPHGAHTREILERVCGYDTAAIDRLVAEKIVYQGADQ